MGIEMSEPVNSPEELATLFEEVKRLRAEVLVAEETFRREIATTAKDRAAAANSNLPAKGRK